MSKGTSDAFEGHTCPLKSAIIICKGEQLCLLMPTKKRRRRRWKASSLLATLVGDLCVVVVHRLSQALLRFVFATHVLVYLNFFAF